MNNSPLVSIIIVNYNGKKYLEECINSLFNQTYENLEIILVDNKSSDDSVSFVRSKFGKILVIENDTNVGFAAGCNTGINASKGSLISLFNQDAIADKEWLSTLVSVIQSDEDIAAVAGNYITGEINMAKMQSFAHGQKWILTQQEPTIFIEEMNLYLKLIT